MAPKKFRQNFAADYTGIDGESTPLEPDAGGVNRAVNYEYAVGSSLRGRLGCQLSGDAKLQPFAMFSHSYSRIKDEYAITYQVPSGVYPAITSSLSTSKTTADGATVSKLFAFNQQCWVKDNLSISFDVVPAVSATYGWYTYVDTVSGEQYFLIDKDSSSTIYNASISFSLSLGLSIYSLAEDITATSVDLAAALTTRGRCPPYGIVNGTGNTTLVGSSTYGQTWSVTVSAHNFRIGDIITFPSDSTLGNGVRGIAGGIVVNYTPTTITYAGQQLSLIDGSILGYMGQRADSFPIGPKVSATSSTTIEITFPYWRLIPEGDSAGSSPSYGIPFASPNNAAVTRSADSFWAPATATSAQGILYFAASSGATASSGFANNLIKVDECQVSRVGSSSTGISLTSPGFVAAGALTGNYRYKIYAKKIDSQGNIWEGPVSPILTVAPAAQSVRLNAVDRLYNGTENGWQLRSCYKANPAEAPANNTVPFLVDNGSGGPAFIQPGDVICLTDNTAQKVGLWRDVGRAVVVGQLHVTRCREYDGVSTATSIKVEDSSGYSIQDNSEISTGWTIVFLRTTAGGNQYYVLAEMPITGYASIDLVDNVTDAVLIAGVQYQEVETGKEHNAPPACSLVCQHQGGLVVARGFSAPNSVSFSTADGLEYFPTASNSLDVPSTQHGPITAIASDTADRLAVSKSRSLFSAVGDLDSGNFSIETISEGDYGISSQASLVRIKNSLVGLSSLGYIAIKDGQIDPFLFRELNTRIINQGYLTEWAVAVNDYTNRNYICSIPTSSSYVSHVIDYSRPEVRTFDRSYPSGLDQNGGMAMLGSDLYHFSATAPYAQAKRLYRFNGDAPTGSSNGNSFIDYLSAISYILESNPISLDDPGLLHTPVRIRVWSLPNDYVQEGWVPFSLQVEGGCSPLASYCGGTSPGATNSTVSFATTNDVFKDVKLTPLKTHFYIVRLTTNTIRQSPFVTGYEVMYAENYEKEDFVK